MTLFWIGFGFGVAIGALITVVCAFFLVITTGARLNKEGQPQ